MLTAPGILTSDSLCITDPHLVLPVVLHRVLHYPTSSAKDTWSPGRSLEWRAYWVASSKTNAVFPILLAANWV